MHRDLKPENMLLGSELNISLADSGFLQYRIFRARTAHLLWCATVSSMAPETLQLQPCDGPKVGVRSLGVTLSRMAMGKVSFVGGEL